MRMNRLIAILLMLTCCISTSASGQSAADNLMRSNGKIYVVVASLLVILACIVAYLIYLDRKLGKLEKSEPIDNDQ